jgi:murein DD-endopeptidase MepM/ murein hydrolase activator NlpD
MRLFSLLLGTAVLLGAVEFPAEVKQGDTLRVPAIARAHRVTFRDQVYPAFAEGSLIPVEALTPPGPAPIKVTDVEGKVLAEGLTIVVSANWQVRQIQRSTRMKELKPDPAEAEMLRTLQHTESPARLWAEPFVAPVPQCVNSPFGRQSYYEGRPSLNYHRGLDLNSPPGTPVHAVAAGTVRIARMMQYPGGTVGIDHGQGVVSTYFHLSKVAAEEGAVVKAGDVVAYTGSTGFATGPHLHFGISVHGVSVNGMDWVRGLPMCSEVVKKPAKKSKAKSNKRG